MCKFFDSFRSYVLILLWNVLKQHSLSTMCLSKAKHAHDCKQICFFSFLFFFYQVPLVWNLTLILDC